MDIRIREAHPGDADRIVAYNLNLARESEGIELDEATLRGGVIRALEKPDYCRYFVAESDGQVVAQTMLTYEWSDWRNGLIWWIQSVYVDPGFRCRGVFRRIFEHLERLATEQGNVVAFRLYVDKNNVHAMATYERLGMHQPEYLIYEKNLRMESE